MVDVDERHFNGSLSFVKQKYGGDPKTATDFRRVLDDKDVDAVTIAAPDHWHALMTIWACQAGKDVYVEKPISHNIVEGRRMIEAARRYDRIVEVGTQRRSNAVLAKAVQFLRDGGLGTVYAGKTVVYRPRTPIGVVADSAVPPGVNYDLWLGPAPSRPFNENHFHYHWHWFWEYGTTDLGNTGVHSLDAVRWLLGKQEHPRDGVLQRRPVRGRRSAPIRRRPIRSTPRIDMRTGPSSTATCATGSAVRPRRRACSSSAARAG